MKSPLEFLYPAVRVWFERERASGNFVDKEDLALEFYSLLEQTVAVLQARQEVAPLSVQDSKILSEGVRRLKTANQEKARAYQEHVAGAAWCQVLEASKASQPHA